MRTSARLLELMLVLAAVTTGAILSASADAPSEETVVSTGWKFQAQDSSELVKHPHQIGSLNEASAKPVFTTVPVLIIPAPGLLKRSQTAQLARLAKEVAGIVNPPSAQHDHTSKKITDGQPRVEAQYGKSGKGLTWAYASLHGENILVMMTQSRDLRPPASAREEFFKMARGFKPAASLVAPANGAIGTPPADGATPTH